MESTTAPTHRPPIVFHRNPLSPGVALDPFPLYKELRELGPVIWLEALGVWGVFRDAEVRELQTDVDRFTAEGGTGLQNLFRETPWREPSPVRRTHKARPPSWTSQAPPRTRT